MFSPFSSLVSPFEIALFLVLVSFTHLFSHIFSQSLLSNPTHGWFLPKFLKVEQRGMRQTYMDRGSKPLLNILWYDFNLIQYNRKFCYGACLLVYCFLLNSFTFSLNSTIVKFSRESPDIWGGNSVALEYLTSFLISQSQSSIITNPLTKSMLLLSSRSYWFLVLLYVSETRVWVLSMGAHPVVKNAKDQNLDSRHGFMKRIPDLEVNKSAGHAGPWP